MAVTLLREYRNPVDSAKSASGEMGNEFASESPVPLEPMMFDAPEIDPMERLNPTWMIVGMVTFLFLIETPYRPIHIPKLLLNSFGVLSALALIFMSINRHYLTLLVLTAYLPFSKVLAGDFGQLATGFNLTNLLTSIIVVGWISRGAMHQNRIYVPSLVDFPLAAFIFLAIIALMRGGLATEGLSFSVIVELKRYLTPICFFYIFSSNIRSVKQLKMVCLTAYFVVLVVAVMAAKEFYMDIGAVSSWAQMRLRGVCQQSNNMGAFFAYYSMFFLAYFLLVPRKWMHWILLILFGICARMNNFTFSRGSMLAFAAASLWVMWCWSKRFTIGFLLSIALFVYCFPSAIPESVIGRFAEIQDVRVGEGWKLEATMDRSAQSRFTHWRGALSMMKHNPIFGIGYGLYQQKAHVYAHAGLGGARDVHQGFLLIGAEMGIPALIAFLVIMWRIYAAGRFLYDQSGDLFLRAFGLSTMGMIAGVIIANCFGDRLNSLELASYYWLLGAAAIAGERMLYAGLIPRRDPEAMPVDNLTVLLRSLVTSSIEDRHEDEGDRRAIWDDASSEQMPEDEPSSAILAPPVVQPVRPRARTLAERARERVDAVRRRRQEGDDE